MKDFERPEKSAKLLDVMIFGVTEPKSDFLSTVLWPYHHYPGAGVLAVSKIMSRRILPKSKN